MAFTEKYYLRVNLRVHPSKFMSAIYECFYINIYDSTNKKNI